MTLDDPMLALITRFVVREADALNLSDEQYLRDQFAAVRRHIESFPENRREQAALDWIAQHAERYRRDWQTQTLSGVLPDRRCPDCPLADDGARSACIIHKRWVGLLGEYVAGEISSRRYIEETLRLLGEHKDHLKVALDVRTPQERSH
ncbi:MAG: hypothetical protein J5I92_03160 [Thiogranum sp.]|nr:hypothetical protein [Thiogranum sp.]